MEINNVSTYNKAYYEANKEKYIERQKRYYAQHKDEIKEKIKDCVKAYQQGDKFKEYKRQYYANTYPSMKQTFECECGKVVYCTKSNFEKHKQTQKHKEMVANKNI